jgi:hypothetical protein
MFSGLLDANPVEIVSRRISRELFEQTAESDIFWNTTSLRRYTFTRWPGNGICPLRPVRSGISV